MSHKKHTSPAILQDAVNLHQIGNIKEAILLYEKILEESPSDHQVLNLLGVAKGQVGD